MTKTAQAHKDRMDAIHANAQAIVATGKCPTCGSGLRRNNSMTGWWQCEQYGAEGFRARPNAPSCSWQDFTEWGRNRVPLHTPWDAAIVAAFGTRSAGGRFPRL